MNRFNLNKGGMIIKLKEIDDHDIPDMNDTLHTAMVECGGIRIHEGKGGVRYVISSANIPLIVKLRNYADLITFEERVYRYANVTDRNLLYDNIHRYTVW